MCQIDNLISRATTLKSHHPQISEMRFAGFSFFMSREFKQHRYFDIKAKSTGRTRTGICSVFGHVDDWGDRVQPGAFSKTISEGRNRVKHLWNHDFSQPPIASIKEIKEIGRNELPQEVLDYAPDATGGLLVTREYYEDSFSDRIFKAISAGDITEMSFGFDVIRHEMTVEGEGDQKRQIRELKEMSLYDTSDVLWGMNNATVAMKSSLPLGALIQQLQLIATEIKAGRRNSSSDLSMINNLHDIALSLGCDNCQPEEPKSAQAEAANSTSLSREWLELQQLELESLAI